MCHFIDLGQVRQDEESVSRREREWHECVCRYVVCMFVSVCVYVGEPCVFKVGHAWSLYSQVSRNIDFKVHISMPFVLIVYKHDCHSLV